MAILEIDRVISAEGIYREIFNIRWCSGRSLNQIPRFQGFRDGFEVKERDPPNYTEFREFRKWCYNTGYDLGVETRRETKK